MTFHALATREEGGFVMYEMLAYFHVFDAKGFLHLPFNIVVPSWSSMHDTIVL